MTRILGLILHGCWHRWAFRETIVVYGGQSADPIIPQTSHYQCTRCGRWKVTRP